MNLELKEPLSLLLLVALQGTVILALAAVATLLLRRAAAALRHLVWGLAVFGLLAAPVLSALLPRWEVPLSSLKRSAAAELVPEIYLQKTPAADAANPSRTPGEREPGAPTVGSSLAAAGGGHGVFYQVGGLLLVLGALVVGLRIGAGWLGVRRLLRAAPEVCDPDWLTLLHDAQRDLGVRRRVRLLRSHRSGTPLCAGTLHPAIVLPREAHSWSAERRRLVLLHELAHIRRYDCLTQLVAQAACALHWFNPLVWLAKSRMQSERELACDDLVLGAGTLPSTYAADLLELARGLAPAPARLAAASVAMVGRGRLAHRLTALLDGRRSHRPVSRRALGAAVVVAVGLLLPLTCLRAGGAAAAAQQLQGRAEAALQGLVRSYLESAKVLSVPPSGSAPTIELTIQPAVQAMVEGELDALLADPKLRADGATALVLDPGSGEILALGSRGAGPAATEKEYNPGRLAVQTAYEPGSTMKIFTVAAALERRTIGVQDAFDCESGSWQTAQGVLHDAAPHGRLTVGEILAVSSNIGAQKIYRTLGKEQLEAALVRFHFGEAPAVQLPAASAGALPTAGRWSEAQAAAIASGQGLRTSPLQTAAAFAALANQGLYNAPTLVRRVTAPSGATVWQHQPSRERVISAATAETVLRLLEQVVQSERGTGQAAQVPGYRVTGKTGTAKLVDGDARPARYYGSFVGALPARAPRLLILVGVTTAQSGYTGGTVAAPAFRRIAERAAAELTIPPSP